MRFSTHLRVGGPPELMNVFRQHIVKDHLSPSNKSDQRNCFINCSSDFAAAIMAAGVDSSGRY